MLTDSRLHRRNRHYFLSCNPDCRHTSDRRKEYWKSRYFFLRADYRKVSVYQRRCYYKRLSSVCCFAAGYESQYMVFLFPIPDIRAGHFQEDSPKGQSSRAPLFLIPSELYTGPKKRYRFPLPCLHKQKEYCLLSD